MIVRLLGSNSSYMIRHPLPTIETDGGVEVPLIADNIDLSTIGLPVDMRKDVSVMKDGKEYRGTLLSLYDNHIEIMDESLRTINIGSYDIVTSSSLLKIPIRHHGDLIISYVTTSVHGEMVYELDADTSMLSSFLSLSNGGIADIDDAKVEISTSDQMSNRIMAMSEPSVSELNTYNVPGKYSIPAGFRSYTQIARYEPDIIYVHVIDIRNGRSPSTYMANWTSNITLPSGGLTIFSDGAPIARTRMTSIVPGMKVSIPMMVTPMLYAISSITEGDTHVKMEGTVYNASKQDEMVTLRYWVGDRHPSDEGYITLNIHVEARSSSKFSHTI